MTVLCNNSAGLGGGPYLGRIPASTITGTASLQGSWTLACRARWNGTNTTTDQYLVTVSNSSNARGYYLQRVNGAASTTVTARRYNGSVSVNDATMTGAYGSTTAWNHLCMTYDGSTIRTYLNGAAGGTIASTNTFIPSGNADSISVAGNSIAESCDVVIFTRALTAAEVLRLARGRFPVDRRNLIGWWPQFSNATLSNCGLDYSGNGNHCTLQASGSGNPASANASIAWPYVGNNRIILPQQVVYSATADGLTNASGAATQGIDYALTAGGLVQVTGSGAAAQRAELIASGLVQASGAAQSGLSRTLTAAGLVEASGAGTSGQAFGVSASGLTQVTGAAAASASGSFAADGLGMTQTTGSASSGAVVPCAGLTQATGTATATLVYLAAAGGLTQAVGGGAVSGASASASGLTASTGSAIASSSAGGDSYGVANKQGDADRRWFGALASRRKTRR